MKLVYCIKCGDIFNINLRYKKCHCGKTSAIAVTWLHVAVRGPGICLGLDNNVLNKKLIDFQNTIKPDSPDRDLKAWLIPFSAPHVIYVDKKGMRLARKRAKEFVKIIKKDQGKKKTV